MIRLLMTSLNMSASTMAMTAGASDQSPISMGNASETSASANESTGNTNKKLDAVKYRIYLETDALIECKIRNRSAVLKRILGGEGLSFQPQEIFLQLCAHYVPAKSLSSYLQAL